MEVKLDFTLTPRRYGVVEQAVFRMVLRGIDSAQAISELLWVFSPRVKAAAIQKLVNTQVLRADLPANRLYPSDGLLSVIGACHGRTYTVELPEQLLELDEAGVWLDERQETAGVLRHILPEVDVSFLAGALSFRVAAVRCGHE